MKKIPVLLVIIAGILFMHSCKVKFTASLTGGDIDARARTIQVKTFPNNAPLVNPIMSQEFTTSLKDKVQGQTSLSIVNGPGDYTLEGEITNYSVMPIAISGSEVSEMTRLTITVNVRFINSFDENKNFERTFSRYADVLSSLNFTSVENTLITTINEELTDEIFNAAFVNW